MFRVNYMLAIQYVRNKRLLTDGQGSHMMPVFAVMLISLNLTIC